jgi:hypothetical protein
MLTDDPSGLYEWVRHAEVHDRLEQGWTIVSYRQLSL